MDFTFEGKTSRIQWSVSGVGIKTRDTVLVVGFEELPSRYSKNKDMGPRNVSFSYYHSRLYIIHKCEKGPFYDTGNVCNRVN